MEDANDSTEQQQTTTSSRKFSLVEEETEEQVKLERAVDEVRELRQQLDEAGRIGLQLYEENVRLKEEAEDMEADFLELEKNVDTWKSKCLNNEKHLKIHVSQLEDSERQIEILEKRVKEYESRAHVAEQHATENESLVKEDKKLLIKNRFKIGALKASATLAHLKSAQKVELKQDMEKLKLKNAELDALLESTQLKVQLLTKEKMTLRGKAAHLKSELKEMRIVRDELVEEKTNLVEELNELKDKYDTLKNVNQRLQMEAQSFEDALEGTQVQATRNDRASSVSSLYNDDIMRRNGKDRNSNIHQISSSNSINNSSHDHDDDNSDDELQEILSHKHEVVLIDDQLVSTPPPFDKIDRKKKRRDLMNKYSAKINDQQQQELVDTQVKRMKISNAIKDHFRENLKVIEDEKAKAKSIMNTTHGSSMQPLSTQEILDAQLNRFKLSNAIKNRFIEEKEEQVHIDSNKINNNTTSSPNPKDIRDAHVQRFKLSNEIKKRYRRSSINNDSIGESASPESIETKGCSDNKIVKVHETCNNNNEDFDDETLHNLIHQIEDKLHTHLRPIFFIVPKSHDNKYTEYEITATYHTGHSHTFIKRYSQFDKLQRSLCRQLKAEGETIITLPHLPPKYMSKSKSMSQTVVAARRDGLLMFLNLMVCLLEGGVSDAIRNMFWDFLEHKFVCDQKDENGAHKYDIVRR